MYLAKQALFLLAIAPVLASILSIICLGYIWILRKELNDFRKKSLNNDNIIAKALDKISNDGELVKSKANEIVKELQY